MKNLFSHHSNLFSKAISQESAIVLLAFISTTLVFGFIVYNYISSLPNYENVGIAANSVFLYYYDGRIWRITIPLQVLGNNRVDLKADKVKVTLNIGDGISADFINISGTSEYTTYDNIVVMGGLEKSLQSCIIRVKYHDENGVIRDQKVNVHVYLDEEGRVHVIVDNDDDGIIDSSYLVEFVDKPIRPAVSLNLEDTSVLEIEENSVLPISYLEYIVAKSIKPDAQIRVVSGNGYYTISVASLVQALTKPVILTSISEGNSDHYLDRGETGSIIILVPGFLELSGGEKIGISIYLLNTPTIKGEITIPSTTRGTGLLVLSGLENVGEK